MKSHKEVEEGLFKKNPKLKKALEKQDLAFEEESSEIHKIYCDQYQKDNLKPYWTGGDYSKLDERTKEYDRNIVRYMRIKIEEAREEERKRILGLPCMKEYPYYNGDANELRRELKEEIKEEGYENEPCYQRECSNPSKHTSGLHIGSECKEEPTTPEKKCRKVAEKIVDLTGYGQALHVNDILPDLRELIENLLEQERESWEKEYPRYREAWKKAKKVIINK